MEATLDVVPIAMAETYGTDVHRDPDQAIIDSHPHEARPARKRIPDLKHFVADDVGDPLEKDKELTEDELKRGEKEIQDVTDDYVARVDKIIAEKETDLMEI